MAFVAGQGNPSHVGFPCTLISVCRKVYGVFLKNNCKCSRALQPQNFRLPAAQ